MVAPDFTKVDASYIPESVEAQTVTFGEDGSVSPSKVVFTFVSPVIPEKTGEVTVVYQVDGEDVLVETVPVSESNNVVAPDMSRVPADCIAVSADPVTVTFGEDGSVSPSKVEFTFASPTPAEKSGEVMVSYMNQHTEFASDTVFVTESDNVVSPDLSFVPADYKAVDVKPVKISFDAAGSPVPAQVVFTYQAPPVSGMIDVLYVDENGNTFVSETVDLAEGQNTVKPNKKLIPEGYTPVDTEAVTVTLFADGSTSPVNVVFTYQAPAAPAQLASVTFQFVDEAGNKLLPDSTIELEDGVYDPSEYAARPEGYAYQGPSADWIYVSGGKASPDEILFTYRKNSTHAELTVRYVDAIGRELADPQILKLKAGVHQIAPDQNCIPAGYVLGSGNPSYYEVEVDADMVARPDEIAFTLVAGNVKGYVTVNYVDVSTMENIASQRLTLKPGTHQITGDDSLAGNTYEPSDVSGRSYTVYVDDLGQAEPDTVTFYYQKKQAETYIGYALVNTQTALRNAYNNKDSSIKAILPENTLVYVNGQATVDGVLWSSVQTVLGDRLDNGVALASALTPISYDQAQAIMAQYEMQTNPNQKIAGYYITLSDNVPLRTYADAQSAAKNWLPVETVVYVSGLEYRNGTGWYASYHAGEGGYIRQDQLRKLTDEEAESYLSSGSIATPAPSTSPNPYDPYGKSSYGYVNSSSVNFRTSPGGTKIKTLNRYAFCLVLGTREVNGVTWYNVNQNGTVGWVHGDYFHHLNLTELTAFLQSPEYQQGVANNSGESSNTASGSTNSSTGVAQPGNIGSVEDWNVGTWQNTGVSAQTSYAPFNPIATATPVPSVSPEASAQVTPTPTFVIGTMIPINYTDESTETQSSTAPWGLIAAGVVLIGGAGGVYAYAMNQNHKRKAAAARAAQARRAQAAAWGGQPQNPQGAAAGRPDGANPYNVSQPQNPYAQSGQSGSFGSSASRNPYSNGSITSSGDNWPSVDGGNWPSVDSTNAQNAAGNGFGSSFAPKSSSFSEPPAPASPADGNSTFFGSDSQSSAMGSNPFARPVSGQQPNPYARPAEEGSENARRRRASRMERYRDAGNGTDAEA